MNMIPRLPTGIFINPILTFSCSKLNSETENFFVHTHEYYEFFLVTENSAVHLINEARIILPPGTLVFIRPDDRHTFEKPQKNFSLINFCISLEFMDSVTAYLQDCYDFKPFLEASMPPTITLNKQKMQKLILALMSLTDITYDHIFQKKLSAKSILIKIFAEYFNNYSLIYDDSDIPLWLSYTYEEMKKIENLCEGLPRMVEIANKSKEHLSRCFKQYYNTTPTDFITDSRLEYICSTLLNQNINITDIVYQSGFQNMSWFYTSFKRKYGMTPKEYITKNVRKKDLSSFTAYYEKK